MESNISHQSFDLPLPDSPLTFIFDTASSLTFILRIAIDIGQPEETKLASNPKLVVTISTYPTPYYYPLETL